MTGMDALLRWRNGNLKLLGGIAILICVFTWAIDLAGLVHPCVYCRVFLRDPVRS